jgi:Holliday junction resolvase RusA-like endonuclease
MSQLEFIPVEAPISEPVTVMVDGLAVAKGRARFTLKGFAYTPANTRKWESHARLCASLAMEGRAPVSGAVRLVVQVELPIPASWSQKKRAAALLGEVRPVSRPDLDNYIKSALDAVNTIVIADDSQVVEIRACKRFSSHPKLIATISPIRAAAEVSAVTANTCASGTSHNEGEDILAAVRAQHARGRP